MGESVNNSEMNGSAQSVAQKKMRKQSFTDLGLSIGEPVTIETMSPKRKLSVKILGFSEGKSILISAPVSKEGNEVLLEKGDHVAVRAMTKFQAFAFESRIIYRAIQPYSYYHLSFPSDLILVEVRRSSRLHVDIPAIISSEFDIGLGDWPKAATVQDISENGSALITRQVLGEIGHEITISIGIQVADVTKNLSIEGIIRNCEVAKHKVGSHYLYGIEFIEISEDIRLALNGFLYELEHRV